MWSTYLISDDARQDWARDAIQDFWTHFLERFADLISGRRSFEPSPIDQHFIGWLEGALEDPIAHTQDAIAAIANTDSDFNHRLSSWMLSQGWEPSSQELQHRQNLERASRLSCYILLTRLVFYQVLRRRFRHMSPLTADGIETPEHLRENPRRQIRRSRHILPRLRDRIRAGRGRPRLRNSVHVIYGAQRLGSLDTAHRRIRLFSTGLRCDRTVVRAANKLNRAQTVRPILHFARRGRPNQCLLHP